MFELQDSWVWCELTIDEGYNRKNRVVFYYGFTPQQEFEIEYTETIKALLFLQEQGFELTNASESIMGRLLPIVCHVKYPMIESQFL